MLQSVSRRNSFARLEVHHLVEQVNCLVVEVLTALADALGGVAAPLGECHFHFRKICEALPGLLVRRAQRLENLKDLPNF